MEFLYLVLLAILVIAGWEFGSWTYRLFRWGRPKETELLPIGQIDQGRMMRCEGGPLDGVIYFDDGEEECGPLRWKGDHYGSN